MNHTCEVCSGQGSVAGTEFFRGKRVQIFVTCHDCMGTGTITAPCIECQGTGLDDAFRYCQCSAGTSARIEDAAMGFEEPAAAGILPAGRAMVNAPGFTPEQFVAAVARAKEAELRTHPAGQLGVVMVQSGSSPAVYAVTRERCDCMAGRTHGHCWHRALVIHLHDVERVPICTVPTIGVNEAGRTVTIGRSPVAAEVA